MLSLIYKHRKHLCFLYQQISANKNFILGGGEIIKINNKNKQKYAKFQTFSI